jgi:Cd2+/Zn2+-exporting ATPase
MRKVLVIIGILTVLGFGADAAAQSDKPAKDVQACTLKVDGMMCSACASKVEKTVLKIDGVKSVKVHQRKGTADITYDGVKTTPEAIAKIITDKAGFKAEAPKAAPKK